jgi:hypothetical protein
MAAATVLADLLHGEQLRPDQRVHQRRLADARRAEQCGRSSGRNVRADRVDAVAARRAHGMDRHAERDGLDLVDA